MNPTAILLIRDDIDPIGYFRPSLALRLLLRLAKTEDVRAAFLYEEDVFQRCRAASSSEDLALPA